MTTAARERGLAPTPRAAEPAGPEAPPELVVAVAATYTAEPIEDALRFWLAELGYRGRVEFSPYNQVLQGLLDPSSAFGRGLGGINLVLVRPEDWARFQPGGWDEAAIARGAEELAEALEAFASRSATPTIVVAPPMSPKVAAEPARAAVVAEAEGRLREAVAASGSLHWLGPDELAAYDVDRPHDEAGDRIGHMPYTPLATAALATAVARRIHAIRMPPLKVVALDCDNTLWRGVVGEDGPLGIGLGPGMRALQEFIVAQQAAGMVVCLVSKNAEADVLEAFEVRDDFPLRREHLVSWRVGWGAKSAALVELSEELGLGLDSFAFLDDNPIECAEVRAALPEVLTLQVPPDEGLAEFLRHAWAFDRLVVTEEDRKRTASYRQNADRGRSESGAADIGAFLASLELRVGVGPVAEGQWARVAQLTQRTNQFNFTTTRRSEAEVRQLGRSGLECLRVEVADRFGDYGLVGVLIFGASGVALVVDTMLLSCRVLGRGVEHAMLAHLGRLALDRGLEVVEARHVPTAKNEPAANFLESVAGPHGSPAPDGRGTVYRVPAAEAAGAAYRPGSDAREQLEFARTGGKPKSGPGSAAAGGRAGVRDRSASYARIAAELGRPEAVLRAVEAASMAGRSLAGPAAGPSTAVERELVGLWKRVLLLDEVGVRDAFGDLGGTSLKAARLFVEIEAAFGVRLPMTTVLEAPTIEGLARRISEAGRGGSRGSLKLLKPGLEGGPALFLVHDGHGETLLYLNLARRLPDDLAVYGLEPLGDGLRPILHTRIAEMADHYVAQAVEARPEGPYLLGGMCAGGALAFEMGLRLAADGREVGLVALLDAADVRARFRPFLAARSRWARLVGLLRGRRGEGGAIGPATRSTAVEAGAGPPPPPMPPDPQLVRVARKAAAIAAKARGLIHYEVGEVRRKAALAGRVRAFREAVGRGGPLPDDLVGPSTWDVYKDAERRHEPSGRLDAPVLLVRAAGPFVDVADEPLTGLYRDPLLGWGPRIVGGPGAIRVVDAPGGHGGMLQEPHVEVVAGAIRDALGLKPAPAPAGEVRR